MKVAGGHIHISRGKSPDPALDDSPVLQSFQKTFCGETASGRDAKSTFKSFTVHQGKLTFRNSISYKTKFW